ncbi:hypothetical protein J7643_00960 [bacterium]|nr:hypothetical protein [bacterium]
MEPSTPQNTRSEAAEREALAKLPTYLTDTDADARFTQGERAGTDWESRVEALEDEAEDTKAQIENTFESPLHQTDEDLEVLDTLITEGWGQELPPEEELATIALEWGTYLGDLIIKNLGGSWVIRQEPEHLSIRFSRLETQFFPVHAVLRRFALGQEATLESTYAGLVATLTD